MDEKEMAIHRLRIESKKPNEEGAYEYDFYFRIGKELNAGYDLETGEPAEIFATLSIKRRDPIPFEDYDKYHRGIMLKNISHGDPEMAKYIHPISKEEYDREHEEDEETA